MKEYLFLYRFQLFWSIIFLYILTLSSLFPINTWHEFEYGTLGNPLILQWEEFFTKHGRLGIHLLARIILQLGDLPFYLTKTSIIWGLLFLLTKHILSLSNTKYFLDTILCVSLLLFFMSLFPAQLFYFYYTIDFLYLSNYYLMAIFLIIFITYYFDLFNNQVEINRIVLYILAFITGSLHELVITCIPLIITIYIILKFQKKTIPSWFWKPIPFFILGFSLLLLSPGGYDRIAYYANASQWDFFGQTINWLELGWKRYWYSLLKHLFYTSSQWYQSPGYIPSTLFLQLFLAMITLLNYQKFKTFQHNKIIYPILWWIFSWYTCIVMSASPMYYWILVEFSKFFLYLALTMSIYYYLQHSKQQLKIIIISVLLVFILVGQGIQIPSLYKARQEYLQLVNQIEKGESIALSKEKLPTAYFGTIKIFTFGSGLIYKYPHLFK